MQPDSLNLLIVDDDARNVSWIHDVLHRAGYTSLRCASDGSDAWDMLQLAPNSIDMILLNRYMPSMDGLELLQRMKCHADLSAHPVIMQCSGVSAEQKYEALLAGAYYYLTKPYNEHELLTIVSGAQRDMVFAKRMQHDIKRFQQSTHLLKDSHFKARTLEDAMYLGSFIANFFPKPDQVVVGLTELLINGIEHGNLGISYLEKGQLLYENRWEDEIAHRLSQPEYRAREVDVHLTRDEACITLKIHDQGSGFEWKRFLEIDPQRASHPHGRGIAIAKMLSFDELEFNALGNEVRCISYLQTQENTPRATAS